MSEESNEYEDDVRGALEAAFDAEEAESSADATEGGAEGAVDEDGSEPETADTGLDGSGETEGSDGQAADGGDSAADEEKGSASRGHEESDSPLLRAPQSWNANAREKWGELPNDIREYIHQREREFNTRIQQTTEDTNYGKTMQEILKPFESVMAMESATPFQAVHSLAKTAATLRMGTPSQKADMIKNLITAYDVDIETLDKALVDEPTQTPEQRALEAMLEKRLGPLEQLLQQTRTATSTADQRLNQQYDDAIYAMENDPKYEFFNDVRQDMADLCEVHYRRTGQELDLPTAYDRAVLMRPDLQQIVSARDAQRKIAEKRAAASVSPANRSPEGGKAAPTDLRGFIEQAWDEQSAG